MHVLVIICLGGAVVAVIVLLLIKHPFTLIPLIRYVDNVSRALRTYVEKRTSTHIYVMAEGMRKKNGVRLNRLHGTIFLLIGL